jgi:hypothetical protein
VLLERASCEGFTTTAPELMPPLSGTISANWEYEIGNGLAVEYDS